MEHSTRTVYGSYIQTCLLLGIAPTYPAHSTLNEKLSINASVLPSGTDVPKLSMYVLGNKGHSLTVGADAISVPTPVQHRGTDAALYGQLPFILRTLDNDIDPTARTKYALRRQETHNTINYIAYYARRLDLTNVTPIMQYKVVNGGVTTPTTFVPSTDNLNPTPPIINNTGVNTINGDYTVAVANINLTLTADDMTELANVGNILYGDPRYAIASEIGLCTGVDKIFSVSGSSGGSFNFNDAIGVQIISHIPALISAVNANTGAVISLSVGAAEPLISLS